MGARYGLRRAGGSLETSGTRGGAKVSGWAGTRAGGLTLCCITWRIGTSSVVIVSSCECGRCGLRPSCGFSLSRGLAFWFRAGREGRSSFPVSEARASSECFSVSELGTGRLDRYRIDRIGSSTYAPAHPLSATPYADSADSASS